MGVQTNQMPRSFDLYCQASCILFTLANQSISAHKKPTGMDKNLAPVSTMTTLQLQPRPLKQLQTLPVWITVPGWNQCQCQYTLLSNAPEKVFQDERNTMKLAQKKELIHKMWKISALKHENHQAVKTYVLKEHNSLSTDLKTRKLIKRLKNKNSDF